MRTIAYCAEPFATQVKRAAGVIPMTSPPVTASNLNTSMFDGAEFIYFDLHGKPGSNAWYNAIGCPAILAEQIKRMNLAGTIVFATNCYLADNNSPMLDALLVAGARYVVAGDGKNYVNDRRIDGAELLGQWLRRLCAIGLDPLRALSLSKIRVRLSGTLNRNALTVSDTLKFRAFERT